MRSLWLFDILRTEDVVLVFMQPSPDSQTSRSTGTDVQKRVAARHFDDRHIHSPDIFWNIRRESDSNQLRDEGGAD
jgi:hypothetical protein